MASFAICITYLVELSLLLHNTEEKNNEIHTEVGQCGYNLLFCNIIIKSADLDEGGGGKTLIHIMWIKVFCLFVCFELDFFIL